MTKALYILVRGSNQYMIFIYTNYYAIFHNQHHYVYPIGSKYAKYVALDIVFPGRNTFV